MFVVAVVMFAVTALGGITAATLHLRNTPPPAWVGRVHGTAALASVIVLAIGVGRGFDDWTKVAWAGAALTFFFVAAVLGRALFSIHVRKGSVPKSLIFVHAGAAVTGLVLLIVQVAGG